MNARVTTSGGMASAPRSRELCIMACVFCRDPLFHAWMRSLASACYQGGEVSDPQSYDDAAAKAFILSMCQVTSRNSLDTDQAAAERFHEQVRKPFVAWKDERQKMHGSVYIDGVKVGTIENVSMDVSNKGDFYSAQLGKPWEEPC